VIELVTCSQCGREASVASPELARWRHGDLALSGDLDDVTAGVLLCPACWAEDLEGQFDAGGED
jgi:hypothetical protein